MKGLLPPIRRLIVECRRKGMRVKDICEIFEVSAYTVWNWCLRAFHRGYESFESLPKTPKHIERKVTAEVENAILALRITFNWGTQRISMVLQSPPPYLTAFLSQVGFETPIKLSRQAINNVLKRHGRNGSPYGKLHKWKNFRASKPNEMWQLDLRGPVFLYGKRVFILVVIDDYSRCMMALELFYGDPSQEDISKKLEEAFKKYGKPEKILTDNGGQFRESWKKWCIEIHHIDVVFAHPHYPQDKGKVERCIRNVNEEVIKICKTLGKTLEEILPQYFEWHNNCRINQGVNAPPALLYARNISNVH